MTATKDILPEESVKRDALSGDSVFVLGKH